MKILYEYIILGFVVFIKFNGVNSYGHFEWKKEKAENLVLQKISSGLIRGRKLITPSKTEGFLFLSIPIAENPTGNLRFRAPIPRQKWNGIFDATNYTVSCLWDSLHTSYSSEDFKMNEDCIHVNVFTNRKCLIKGGCAVAMYIHGGAFEFGTPLQYRQDFIVDNFNNASRNVVFVSMGFRQAFFGVANFNHKLKLSIDVNAGFHDIIHALYWIKKEIKTFGGDPDMITVMGHSGGGALAKMLAMSPKSKHLINQIIAMSESSDYSIVKDKNQAGSRAAAQEIGSANFPPSDKKWDSLKTVEKVIKCLRLKPAKELAKLQPKVEEKGYQFRFVAQDSGDNAVLPRTFAELFHEMLPIPILTGTVSKEFQDGKSALKKFENGSFIIDKNELHKWAIKALSKVEYLKPDSRIINLVEKEYETPEKVPYIYDDVVIYVQTFDLTKSQALKGAKSYLYEYTYPNIGKAYDRGMLMSEIDQRESPHHAQELAYLLGQHAGNFTSKDYKIKFLYSQIFVDFINHGSPASLTRKWSPFDPERKNYFVIDFPDPDLTSPGEADGYHSRAIEFWDNIIPRVAGTKTPILREEQINNDPIPIKNISLETPLIALFEQSKHGPETIISAEKTPSKEKSKNIHIFENNNYSENEGILIFWISLGVIVFIVIAFNIYILRWIKFPPSKKDEYQRL